MRLALIGTFYGRHERTRSLLRRVYEESDRVPDEFWLMCEDWEDVNVAGASSRSSYVGLHILHCPTPRTADGDYAVLPYSWKINHALGYTDAAAIAYLDNGSLPHPRKYMLMAAALEAHPEYGAVYCAQAYTGFATGLRPAEDVVEDAYSVLNYTQVMHRPTADRWSLDLADGRPHDLADALFWRALHRSLGPFYPVSYPEPLDEHHIEASIAVGL